MRISGRALVIIFAIFMGSGTSLVFMGRDEMASTIFTSAISFLVGCGVIVAPKERAERNEERKASMF